MTLPCLRQGADGVFLDLHVQPRASRNALAGLQGDALKIRLTSPPVEGAANRLCVEFLARLFALPKCDVILTAGDKSRHKRILLRGLALEDARRVLAAALAEVR